MRHYRHTVKRWLTIEDGYVPILKMPFHNKTRLNSLSNFGSINNKFKPYALTVRSNNIERTRIFFRSIYDELPHLRNVPLCHFFGNRQAHSNFKRDTNLVY